MPNFNPVLKLQNVGSGVLILHVIRAITWPQASEFGKRFLDGCMSRKL